MRALRQCRICGAIWPYPSHYWITEGGGCRTCGGSPLCDTCGHPRAKPVAVYKKGKRRCAFRTYDMQSLAYLDCDCPGYAPVEGGLSEAEFARPDSGPLPPLRLANTEPPRPVTRHGAAVDMDVLEAFLASFDGQPIEAGDLEIVGWFVGQVVGCESDAEDSGHHPQPSP
jgi:hypothetical protein